MNRFRKLSLSEIEHLRDNYCTASDWEMIQVAEDFSPEHVFHTRFSGAVRLGTFRKEFSLPGGIKKHSGLYHVTLHNVTVGDDCCIENVSNYIANYTIGDGAFIENVDVIIADGPSSFGNGVKVAVLDETGHRKVTIFDRLTAQTACLMTMYHAHSEAQKSIETMISDYVAGVTSATGSIGSNVVIADTGYIKNVKIGDCCKIEGASRLKNGSINSTRSAPVHIGVGVIGDDFIISSGTKVDDGVTLTRCFIGQACVLGHGYSATDSLFFANCQGEHGEACSIFAGPYTVTHHKSTLLIAGMFSFMNAGSGSNQSNHLYKLGPIHHGVLERGAKTASDSYILWPAKVGAFSLVMGRHVNHQDTSDLPFSYLIEDQSISFIVPGANLKSVGTIRDARKWPDRDARKDPDLLDCINFNLLSPYTIRKMFRGIALLENLQHASGENSESYAYQSGRIRRTSLLNGLKLYRMAIDKFLGNSLISRIMSGSFHDTESLRNALIPNHCYGAGEWTDLAGLIAPVQAVDDILSDLSAGKIPAVSDLNHRFKAIHESYYEYEWGWAYGAIGAYYGLDLSQAEPADLRLIIAKWKESVLAIDKLLYDDARKDYDLNAIAGISGLTSSEFERYPFVISIKEHMSSKSELADTVLKKLNF